MPVVSVPFLATLPGSLNISPHPSNLSMSKSSQNMVDMVLYIQISQNNMPVKELDFLSNVSPVLLID